MNKIKFRSFAKTSNRISTSCGYFIGVKKEIPISDSIPVYTDGSCINNGKPNAISSIGVYFPTKKEMYTIFENTSYLFLGALERL
jgi:hypothetical protein